MALIKCPECGRDISDRAEMCIGCGISMTIIKEILAEMEAEKESAAVKETVIEEDVVSEAKDTIILEKDNTDIKTGLGVDESDMFLVYPTVSKLTKSDHYIYENKNGSEDVLREARQKLVNVLAGVGIEKQKNQDFLGIHKKKIGDTIKLGRYPQGTDGTEQDIEWQVLAKKEDKVLVISKYVLDWLKFNDAEGNTSWSECTLRTWLNKTFLKTALSTIEAGAIAVTTIEPVSGRYANKVHCGSKTFDKVFLLSGDEANQYFENDYSRICKPTNYAISKGSFENNTMWWLRSSGSLGTFAKHVFIDGTVSNVGIAANFPYGVRPAMWVKCPKREIPKDGYGELHLEDGGIYHGEIKDGMPNGSGIIKWDKDLDFVLTEENGVFKDGVLNGYGKRSDRFGHIYQGIFKEGVLNGYGKVIHPVGDSLSINEGHYKDGRLDGYGIRNLFNNGKMIHGEEGLYENGALKKGKYLFPENVGLIYEGNFKENRLDGFGRQYYSNGKLIEDGIYKAGKLVEPFAKSNPQGVIRGELKLSDNGTYYGELVNGVPNGNGKITFGSGVVYEGYFENFELKRGKITYTNGEYKEGYFSKGKLNGPGKYVKSGYTQEGNFEDDKLDIYGKTTWSDNESCQGESHHGNRTGYGKYSFSDGGVYSGEFKDNVRTGFGIYVYSNESTYSGMFEGGERSGYGNYSWKEGDYFSGTFKGNKRNGYGNYNWPNGEAYYGECKDGKFSGNGKYFHSDGAISEGQFEDTNLVKGKKTWPDGRIEEV